MCLQSPFLLSRPPHSMTYCIEVLDQVRDSASSNPPCPSKLQTILRSHHPPLLPFPPSPHILPINHHLANSTGGPLPSQPTELIRCLLVSPSSPLPPQSLALSGKTCPGRRKDIGVTLRLARARHVSARSWADIPVVTAGSQASTETV